MAAHLVIIFYDPMRQANGHACAAGYANRSYFRRAAEPLADIPNCTSRVRFWGKSELVLNLRTAKSLGLVIPQAALLRA
ncbi:MAG: hypothetical protein WCF83_09435, partial [Pseudolabrys sp.]